jgi:hypothetical protein
MKRHQRYRSQTDQIAKQFCSPSHTVNNAKVIAKPSYLAEITNALDGWIKYELPSFAHKVLSINKTEGFGTVYFSIATIRGMHTYRNEGTIWLHHDKVSITSNVDGVGGHFDYEDPKLFEQLKMAIFKLYNGSSGRMF